MGTNAKHCCDLFYKHLKEGFFKRKRYFVSGEEGVSPSETGQYFAEISVRSEVESRTIKMPLNYCPFCGEKLG